MKKEGLMDNLIVSKILSVVPTSRSDVSNNTANDTANDTATATLNKSNKELYNKLHSNLKKLESLNRWTKN
jgi:hypothetical protein